jgi:hypothetical protein
MPSLLTGYQKTLVDALFHERDQQLLNAFRDRMEKMDRRAQLTQVSGISDEAVLDRLIELDIGPETLAAIEVVPLLSVAWADGRIQPEERKAIIAAAAAAGIQPQDGRYSLLEYWLEKRPSADMFDAWKHYISGLCQRLDKPEIERLKNDVLDLARNVAQAAGGFLGIGNRISTAERTVLGKLERTFS